MKTEYNIARLEYQLSLYKMTIDELLHIINDGYKKSISKNDIYSETIEINYLKRIDKIFNKGLTYYVDMSAPIQSKDSSIFFRKDNFGTELNLSSKKVVNQFEEQKTLLSAIAKLAEIKISRTIPEFNISQNPRDVANTIHSSIRLNFLKDKKQYLSAIITKLAENNIFVFEYIETWNKKEKSNINGFYLLPNTIVIKRQQKYLRREIFTLIHEFGHYLINSEEIEDCDDTLYASNSTNQTERWCNDFAYYFLSGEYAKKIDDLDYATEKNDFHTDIIENISKSTHLSKIALYTRLLYQQKISKQDYNGIKDTIQEQIKSSEEKEKKEQELSKLKGEVSRGSTPKPIISPLLASTLNIAYYSGVIDEAGIRQITNLSADRIWNLIK